MKNKLITIAAATVIATSTAMAQSQVAGWDFSQVANLSGFISTGDINQGQQAVIAALTNDLDSNYTGGQADFSGAAGIGSFLFDGTFGSTALGNDPFAPAQDIFVNGAGNTSTADKGFIGTGGSLNTLEFQGQTNTNNWGLGFNNGAEGDSFVVAVDLTSQGLVGESWGFSFAGLNVADPDNASSIAWEVSTDGINYAGIGTTAIANSAAELGFSSASLAALDGSSTAFFRGTLSGIDGVSQTFIDNVSVEALTSPIPEPSTYAAIAGALALAVVAYRRRS